MEEGDSGISAVETPTHGIHLLPEEEKKRDEHNSELGTRQFFSFATTTTRDNMLDLQ